MPVQSILVVDDASTDTTAQEVMSLRDPRVQLLQHVRNMGVGRAISTGYTFARNSGASLAVVMAGDGQMDPADLPALVRPLLRGHVDYAKGNRMDGHHLHRMPTHRKWGNRVLAKLTTLALGQTIRDSQCGYTAITTACLRALPLDRLWPRYGYPNDLLGMLHTHGFKTTEVPIHAVYADEASGIRGYHAWFTVPMLLLRWTIPARAAQWMNRAPTRRTHYHKLPSV